MAHMYMMDIYNRHICMCRAYMSCHKAHAPVFTPLLLSVQGGGPVEEEIEVEGLEFLLVALLLLGGWGGGVEGAGGCV